MTKGTLMAKIRNDKGKPVMSATNIEIPVTPPSMKWLESRKPFTPIPADKIPTRIMINCPIAVFSFMPKDNGIIFKRPKAGQKGNKAGYQL